MGESYLVGVEIEARVDPLPLLVPDDVIRVVIGAAQPACCGRDPRLLPSLGEQISKVLKQRARRSAGCAVPPNTHTGSARNQVSTEHLKANLLVQWVRAPG